MTLKDYIQTLPKERVDLAATDIDEAAKIEQEHAALPNAVLDTEDAGAEQPMEQPVEQTVPDQSFDINSDQDAANFIKGMELSHPELVMKLRRDEKAWDEMLEVDRRNVARMNRDGGIKFTGDDQSDYDFYRWAYGRGMMQSDSSIENLISSFSRGLWQMAKGAVKVAIKGSPASMAANPAAANEMAATVVDAAQASVAEYQQLGAGLAALTAGDDPQVKMAAMYELAKFVDTEQKNHNAWRKSVSEGFAAIPVDQDAVEFLTEPLDISNVIGFGAGKLVTAGAKRVGLNATAEVLGKSRAFWGSDVAAGAMSKVPVVGTPYKRAILMGQVDNLSVDAQAAYAEVAAAQADLAAKRATLAASPASDPKDVLLKQIADGEADLATKQAAYNATQSQLDAARQGVSQALDVEGRGIANRAAAGTLETAGNVISGTGRLMTQTYRGASELLTGQADNAAFDMAADRLGGSIAGRGNFITRVGNDISIAGRTLTESGASIPYFRRLRQAEDASKLTRGAAAFVDWSNLGWAADKTGDLLKAGAAGAPVSGGFGYIASGGDLAAAAESAGAGAAYGIGGGAYGQWEAYTDPRFRYDELLANRRQFRDTLSRREINGQSQLKIFDQMDAGDQLAVSTYAQGKPDVAFRFINDPKQASGYYDRDNNVVVVNKASPTPVGDIFRHEVAHFVERHGLQTQVREMYLGDAEKGVIGQYTALDSDGTPLVVETTGPDGSPVRNFKLNAEGERLKAEYEGKIRAVDPTFSMSPEYFASELFAEHYADRLMGGNFRRDLSRNTVDNIVDSLASKPLLKNFLGGIGLLFDQNDNIVGTGVFSDLKRNPAVEKLISRWESEAAKGKRTGIQDEVDQHVFTETELRDPAVATKWLQGGGAVRFGPDGKPVFDAKGTPQFLTEKEADALQRDLANEIITQIEKYALENPGDSSVIQRREIVDVNKVKRTLFSGRRIPASVIDAIEAQNRFNPHQLAHLRAASATVEKHGVGAMIAHFYQAASRKLGGKAYKTVGGRWRRDGVVGFQVTKDGNVVLNTVSWEQLAENARKAARTKLARETYATAGIPVEAAITADVKTYLGNLVDGKPGAADIGETRRDFINNLLGIRMAANADANPLFETTDAPKTILTSLRLDRMNRMAPLDTVEVAWGPQQYRQAQKNQRPDAVSQGVNLEQFMQDGDRDLQFRPNTQFKEPQKTITAYKLFRTLKSKPGQLFPLFIGNNKPVPVGEWLVAENLPTKGFAARPGWHAGAIPSAPHLMTRDGKMAEGRVWAEVQMPADVDYTPEAMQQPTRDFKDRIPENGFYKFSTQKEQGEHGWVIAGALKVTRILKPSEVDAINAESGVQTTTEYDKANVQYRPQGAAKLRKVRVLPENLAFPEYQEGASGEGGSIRSKNTAKKEATYKAQGLVPVAAGGVGEIWVKPEEAEFIKKSGFGRSHLNQMALHAYQLAKAGIDPEILRDNFVRELVENLGYDGSDAPEMKRQFDRLRGNAIAAVRGSDQTETPEFKNWFGKSKVVAANKKPLVVFHGTTHDFTSFDAARSNIENDWGKGFYFSNTPDDIAANYAGVGPDLTNRIERTAENKFADLDDEDAKQKATEELKGSHDGAVVPVYLSIQNPLIVGGRRETNLGVENFIAELQIAAQKYNDADTSMLEDDIKTNLAINVEGYEYDDVEPTVQEIVQAAKEALEYASDDAGNLASNEIVRSAIEAMGFDGIIDRSVNKKFGSESSRFLTSKMAGMDENTVHYVAFKPTQIKSAISNRGTFDSTNPNIQYRPEAKRPTPREIEVVAQELGLENLDSGAKEFGGFMRQIRQKGITGRDVVKAYLITTSSVNRGAVNVDTVRKSWPDLTHGDEVIRPEDAFAKLLGTDAGQRYLNAAVGGKFDEEAANEMLEKFKPFGLYNTQRELMRNAAETLAPMSDAIVDAVENLPTEQYADFVREHFKGISYGKVGFMSGMLGRGDLPTVDTRQRQLHYGPDKINVDKRILLEVRDRLAQLEIPITEDMRPFYQTMVHHAVWDRLAGTDTTHADIKEAMLQFRPDTTQPKSEVAGFTPTKDVTNIPDISLEDLRGVKVFPILADLTAVGTYEGIDAAAVVPVDMFGGPNYPFIPENRDAGVVWANEGKGLGTRKTKLLQETDGYAIVVAMTQNTHVSNSTTVRAFINTLDAYVKDGRVKPAGIKKADRAIKGLGVSLPSVSDPAFGDAVRALSFDARSAVVGQLERAEFEEYGFPSAKRVIDAVRDPDFDGVDYGDGLLVVRLDPEDTVVKLGEQGTPKHPDYTYGVRGRVVGRLKRPLPSKLVFSEFFAERRAANASVPHDARAFSLKMPIAEITDEKIAAAKRLETTVASNAQQMRAALAAATGSWQTSDVAVNKGGVGIADFVRALRDNEYAPSLTPYDESQVKEKVKAGQMRVFKLQNAEIYFALVRDGDKTVISSVVNNEPGARGIAAPAVLSKAIAAGATHLDCFAVTSQKYPNGFLPTLYSLFGFEQEGERVDFSQEMFDADWKAAGENPQKKFADLLRLWQRDGWNPTTQKPQVTFMRLRDDLTSNDSRQSYTRRLLETPTGELADRGRTTRRGVQPDAQSRSEGAGDRGAAGDNARPDRGAQGVGGRVSPAARGIDRFRELVRDLARLTDEHARVRGLDLNQLQALRAELAATP